MSRDRQPSRPGRWASRIRRFAVVALLAIASSSLLPLIHGAVSHVGDCGVCSVFAHNGTSIADVVSQPAVLQLAARPERVAPEAAVAPPRPAFDRASARAPPTLSVSI